MDLKKGDEVTIRGTVDYVGPDHVTVIVRGVAGSVHQLHAHVSQVQGAPERGFAGTHTPTGREIRPQPKQ